MGSEFYLQFLEYGEVVEFMGWVGVLEQAMGKSRGQLEQMVERDVPQGWRPSFSSVVSRVLAGEVTWGEVGESLRRMRRLELTVAIPLSHSDLLRVGGWVKQNIGQEVVVDLKQEPGLVGGCVIDLDGKHVDMSVRRRLDEWYSKTQAGGSGK